MRFELTNRRFCRPRHWTALVPMHCCLAEQVRLELTHPIAGAFGFQDRCRYADSANCSIFGIPPGTRTPTNGFGDRYAAITPARHFLACPERFELPTLALEVPCSDPAELWADYLERIGRIELHPAQLGRLATHLVLTR